MENRKPKMTLDELLSKDIPAAWRGYLNTLHARWNTRVNQDKAANDRDYFDAKKSLEEIQIYQEMLLDKEVSEAETLAALNCALRCHERYLQEQNEEYKEIYLKIEINGKKISEFYRELKEHQERINQERLKEKNQAALDELTHKVMQIVSDIALLKVQIKQRQERIASLDTDIIDSQDAVEAMKIVVEYDEALLLKIETEELPKLPQLEEEKAQLELTISQAETDAREQQSRFDAVISEMIADRDKELRALANHESKDRATRVVGQILFQSRYANAQTMLASIPPRFSFNLTYCYVKEEEKATLLPQESILLTINTEAVKKALAGIKSTTQQLDEAELREVILQAVTQALTSQVEAHINSYKGLIDLKKQIFLLSVLQSPHFESERHRLTDEIQKKIAIDALNEKSKEIKLNKKQREENKNLIGKLKESTLKAEKELDKIKENKEKIRLEKEAEIKELKDQLAANTHQIEETKGSIAQLTEKIKQGKEAIQQAMIRIKNKREERKREDRALKKDQSKVNKLEKKLSSLKEKCRKIKTVLSGLWGKVEEVRAEEKVAQQQVQSDQKNEEETQQQAQWDQKSEEVSKRNKEETQQQAQSDQQQAQSSEEKKDVSDKGKHEAKENKGAAISKKSFLNAAKKKKQSSDNKKPEEMEKEKIEPPAQVDQVDKVPQENTKTVETIPRRGAINGADLGANYKVNKTVNPTHQQENQNHLDASDADAAARPTEEQKGPKP